MTVETTTSRAQYSTNGTTGPWTVPFKFLQNEDLQVIYTDAQGADTILTLDVGYAVTGAGGESGTVTTTAAYGAGGFITILRDIEPLQESDYVDGDPFPAETFERNLDRLTMLIQQALEMTTRAIAFPPSENFSGTLPPAADRADRMPSFGEYGALTLAPFTVSQVAVAIAAAYGAGASQSTSQIFVTDFPGVDKTGGSDCTAGINVAMSVAAVLKAKLYWPAGTYLVDGGDGFTITTSCMSWEGDDMGYARNLLPFDPSIKAWATRILVRGTINKKVRTRALYRGSSSDPHDDPISCVVAVENDAFRMRRMMIELECDYTDTSPTNLGADCDVGVFNSRQDCTLDEVQIIGYFRRASILKDSTRMVNAPELNGAPSTFGAGSDGMTLQKVQTTGGRYGYISQGPKPKAGLRHFGFQYRRAAKFVFAGQPTAADTVTVAGVVYTFRALATHGFEVTIGASVAATIANLAAAIEARMPLVAFDTLTLVPGASALEIYSTSTSATALAESSANIAIQTLAGAAATQTETISDPAPYYDDTLGLIDDGRGALGGSDLICNDSVLSSFQHHSKRRITDPATPRNADTDPAAGAVLIDGLGGSGLLHRHFFNNTRFWSVEPFCVNLRACARVRFVNCTHEFFDARWTSTTGAAITNADTYGRISGVAGKTSLVQSIGYDDPGNYFPLGRDENQIYSHFYTQGFDVEARRQVRAGSAIYSGTSNTNADTGLVEIISGVNANAEIRFSSEAVGTIGRVRQSPAGVMTLATRTSAGTGAITDRLALFDASTDFYNNLRPSTDNTIPFGSAARRVSEVFAGNGTINTSDARVKQDVQALTTAERAVAVALKGLVKSFRFIDAVQEKGDDARIHVGFIAQDVVAAFAAEGLDAAKYGILCYDEWPDEWVDVTETRVIHWTDAEGRELSREETFLTGERVLVTQGGNRYSLRYEQLLAFIIGAM